MEMSKKNKTLNAFAIAVFTAVRVGVFSYFPNLSDKTPYIPFILLIAAFSLLTAALAMKVSERCEKRADAMLALVLADFFFTLQNNAAFLAVAVLWEACALIALAEKKTFIKEAVVIAVSFVSALLLPYSAFSYALLAAFICFMVNRRVSAVKALVCSILTILGGISGLAVHNLALKNTAEFINFINTFTLGTYSQTVYVSFVAVIPTVLMSIVLIKMLVTNSKAGINRSAAAEIKNGKKEMQLYIAGMAVLYIISVAGLIMKKYEMYLLINQLVYVICFAMILNKNSAAEKTIERINTFFTEHSFAALIIFVLVFGIQMLCIDRTGQGGAIRDGISRLIY